MQVKSSLAIFLYFTSKMLCLSFFRKLTKQHCHFTGRKRRCFSFKKQDTACNECETLSSVSLCFTQSRKCPRMPVHYLMCRPVGIRTVGHTGGSDVWPSFHIRKYSHSDYNILLAIFFFLQLPLCVQFFRQLSIYITFA